MHKSTHQLSRMASKKIGSEGQFFHFFITYPHSMHITAMYESLDTKRNWVVACLGILRKVRKREAWLGSAQLKETTSSIFDGFVSTLMH